MPRLRAPVIGALSVVGVLAPALCAAQPAVRWTSTECHAERPLADRVAELRGEPPRSSVEVRVEREGESLRMSIALDGEPIRTLSGDSCEALFEAAAVVIALAEAQRDAEPESPEPSPPDVVTSPAEALGPPDAVPAPEPSAPDRLAFALAPSVAVSSMIGLLPTVSAGPALGLDVTLEWVRLRILLSYLAPSTASGMAGAGVQVDAWGGSAALCVRIFEGPPSPSICAQASLALLTVSVVGGTATDLGSGLGAWGSFGGAVALDIWDFQPGRLWIEVAVGVTPNEFRPSFQASVVDDTGGRSDTISFTPDTFSGRLSFGASFDFWM